MPAEYCTSRLSGALGAALALGGWARRLSWIPRREACGQPCQLCRHRCEYRAIDRSGGIRYQECFQCMDCVAIYHDSGRCAPLLLEARKGRRVVPIAVSRAPGGAKAPAGARARLPVTTPEGS